MALMTTTEMLKRAQQGGYAIGAFNIDMMEMAQAVLSAAEEARAPIIIQTTTATLAYASPGAFFGMVSEMAKEVSVPVALHLDHGASLALAKKTLEAGYTSVMFDGSRECLAENIALTRQVVEAAAAYGVPVEAELGKVGGQEDAIIVQGAEHTDPEEARSFVQQTGVASLAVSIGTAHGFYQGTPTLDFERLSQIRSVVPVPLVLHGASGLSEEDIKACIARGICKINIATELRVAFTQSLRGYLREHPAAFDPKEYGPSAREAMKKIALAKMHSFGCAGKA